MQLSDDSEQYSKECRRVLCSLKPCGMYDIYIYIYIIRNYHTTNMHPFLSYGDVLVAPML
jgi:hypothetical protein